MPRKSTKHAAGVPTVEDFRSIPLTMIDHPLIPMRTEQDQKSLIELAESMATVGHIQPIAVMQHGDRFEIIAGDRRYRAAVLNGWTHISAIVHRLPTNRTEAMKAHENLIRADVSPIDEATYLHKLQEVWKCNQTELADKIGRSKAYVSEKMKLLGWHRTLIDALSSEKITYSVARELSRIDDDEARSTYLHYAIENGATPAVAKRWVDEWKAGLHQMNVDSDKASERFDASKAATVHMPCAYCDVSVDITTMTVVHVCDECNDTIVETLQAQ